MVDEKVDKKDKKVKGSPGPIHEAWAGVVKSIGETILYSRFILTLGAVVFITNLAVQSAKAVNIFNAKAPSGEMVTTISLQDAIPLALLTAVLTALVGILGGLIAGPNPLAVIAEKLIGKLK